ncbi:MAG: HAMP domain-containing protein [Desulfocapsa sp.]|jgi:two-component system sensor histidine kinase CpxA|nr:HAMP domain-containing protein [Desulfocapsa sp.]
MHSLFYKIFLSFLLITLLASITTVIISYLAQVGPYGALKKRVEQNQIQALTHYLSVTGLAAVKILDNGGKEALRSYLLDVEKQNHSRIFLFQEDNNNLLNHTLPQGAANLAVSSQNSHDIQYNISETEIIIAVPLFTQDGQNMTLVGSTIRVTRPNIFIDKKMENGWRQIFFLGHRFGLPVIVVLFIAGAGCYLLARSLTAPIRDLRKATQQMSKGDFSTRINLANRRKDEIAGLSRDFNTMAERTQSLIRSQKRLLRDVSHELRSPLTRQTLALELAKQRFSNGEPYLARIEKESRRLGELIDQLLILTRLEGNMDNCLKEPVDLHKLLTSIVHDAAFEAVYQDRGVDIRTLAEVTVSGSIEMIHRALENVIRNGLRYTAIGSNVEITLSKDDPIATITVRDHGTGIPQEYHEQIFKPFFRVEKSRNQDSGGTGIGLAIAKQAILMHNGSILARNARTGGLVIEIRLPLS